MATMAELEILELENGVLTPANCAILLANYLARGDIINAKFLWTRTPAASKKENDEIDVLWVIGKKLSSKDFPAFFDAAKGRQWSESVAPLIAELTKNTRHRVFRLICLAYTTIRTATLAAMIDLPVEEAILLAVNPNNAQECRWNLDVASQTLEKTQKSFAPIRVDETEAGATADYRQRQFQVLTDYVSFLEN